MHANRTIEKYWVFWCLLTICYMIFCPKRREWGTTIVFGNNEITWNAIYSSFPFFQVSSTIWALAPWANKQTHTHIHIGKSCGWWTMTYLWVCVCVSSHQFLWFLFGNAICRSNIHFTFFSFFCVWLLKFPFECGPNFICHNLCYFPYTRPQIVLAGVKWRQAQGLVDQLKPEDRWIEWNEMLSALQINTDIRIITNCSHSHWF